MYRRYDTRTNQDATSDSDPKDIVEEWWKYTRRHRSNGPARITADGTKEWWLNGVRHRTDGPAVIKSNGSEEWWLNGKRHRTNGPAVVYPDNSEYVYVEWWLDGRFLSFCQWQKEVDPKIAVFAALTYKINHY